VKISLERLTELMTSDMDFAKDMMVTQMNLIHNRGGVTNLTNSLRSRINEESIILALDVLNED